MADEWPRCKALILIMEQELDCCLPEHHELDGSTRHKTTPDADGHQIEWEWRAMVIGEPLMHIDVSVVPITSFERPQ